METLSRREFFRSCSKDMLKDVMRSWHTFSTEVKKTEEKKLSCEEAAIELFCKTSAKKFRNNPMLSMNRKEGQKI